MYKHVQARKEVLTMIRTTKADSLTGFVAGVLVGVMGMMVFAVIVGNLV